MRAGLLAPLVVAAVLTVPAGGADAAAPMCQGKGATIVGNASELFSATGTPGADVIVTNGAGQATGRGGNDLICVTKWPSTTNAGSGNDVVVIQVKARMYAYLGPGDDTYIGTDQRDTVTPQGGRDVVRTFGGADEILLADGRPRAIADLGAGDDSVIIGRHSGGSRVNGGPGDNTLAIEFLESPKGKSWRFDSTRGIAHVDGKAVARWSSIRTFDLHALTKKASKVVFTGTAADEMVDLSGYAIHRKVRLDLGGGDDVAAVTGFDRGRVLLGTGHDGLAISRATTADVDLIEQVADLVTVDDADTNLALGGVDDVSTSWIEDVALSGDGDDNVLRAEGVCNATLHGLGGDDRLDVGATACDGTQHQVVIVEGNAGDDVLFGSFLDDLLDGGPGTDVAKGEDGEDTCYAEKRTSCELP